MTHPDPAVAITQFLGTLPIFLAVFLTRTQNNKRIDDLCGELKDSIKSESALIRAEMRRVGEVMDARLKHLKERESH